jgi:hypothetical protein
MFDESYFERAECAADERLALAPLARRLGELASLAHEEGLLALGRYLDDPDADLAAALRELLAEGREGTLSNRLRALVDSSGSLGAELLRRMMIAIGLSDLDSGRAPDIVELKALACLGADRFFSAKREGEIRRFVDSGLDRALAERIVT